MILSSIIVCIIPSFSALATYEVGRCKMSTKWHDVAKIAIAVLHSFKLIL